MSTEKFKSKNLDLSTSHWIVKSNRLNELRGNRMTISQIRLFTIYLSRINPRDVTSREVIFKLEDYTRIMQFKKTNTERMIKVAEGLLGLTAAFVEDREDGDVAVCQLFKRFRLFKNPEGQWLVSIDCHDDVLKLMFDLRGYYFKYQLWNALQLTSPNQQRMYEILKQYESAGAREIKLRDLREFLGIKPEEYTRWDNFKRRVLDASQTALSNYTDIKFTWEVTGKRGAGGKAYFLKFFIEKNDNYERQISLNEYLTKREMTVIEGETEEFTRPDGISEDAGGTVSPKEIPQYDRAEDREEVLTEEYDAGEEAGEPEVSEELQYFEKIIYPFLASACKNEFRIEEIQVLYNLIIQIVPHKIGMGVETYQLAAFDYLKRKYDELSLRAKRTDLEPLKSRFGYLKRLIELEFTGE